MPSLPIEPHKVMGVILETNRALKGQGFNQGEVMVGLAELIGRVIVEQSHGPSQTEEFKRVVKQHIDDTIQIGLSAQGKIYLPGG